MLSSGLLACAATSELDLDREAALEEDAGGKADGIGVTRLERATASEVADSFAKVQGDALVACFAGYQAHIDASATRLTRAVADDFIDVSIATDGDACGDWFDLKTIVHGVLDARGFASALPSTVVSALPGWARPQLEAALTDGFVDVEDADLLFYDDIMRVHEANARSRERAPTGIDLAAVREAWDEVRGDTTLDRAYLNPVTFSDGALDSDQIFRSLRKAFPLRGLSLESTGFTAIDEFAAADEGPDGDPAFAPIAKALRKSSIRKRFYYAASNSEWSSNVLIVIDEHGQAYGMQMGYSE